ncbi:MAG: UPF0182 family protein [Ignavibacteria bacterium]|nr:UPF0182 family protein [Ignavibacteria bacterium]
MKPRRILLFTVLAVVAILGLLGFSATFLTNMWWFASLDLGSVFWTTYKAEYGLWLGAFFVFLLILLPNLRISLRSQGTLAVDPRFEALVQLLGKFLTLAVYGGAAVLAFLMAGAMSMNWMELLSFLHSQPFNAQDPLFGNDVGFYIFTLPFLNSLRTWLLFAVVLTMGATVLVYLVRQGVSFAFGRLSVSAQARKHIAILAGIFFALVAFGYWLGRYDVLYSTRSGSFYGAGYTDTMAQIPAAWIMMVVTLFAGLAIAQGLFVGAYKRIAKAFGGFVVAAVVVGALYPVLMQKFIVNPNEQSKELPYIRNNIAFTRQAYDIDRIEERSINPKNDLTASDIEADSATIRNIMLWDYRPLASTFDQLQVIRLYYDFPDIDIDRYHLPNGTYRQVMLSARELNQGKLPANAKTWVNLNLVYTHGYGLGMSPVNVVTEEGLPEFFLKDIPPQSNVGLEVTRPEIYYGEETGTPVVVKGNIDEFDYPLGDQNQMTKYKGESGVGIGSFFRRLMYAMHFGEWNLLISSYLADQSRILYVRNIQDRVQKIAPFLTYDRDPYLVVAEGCLFWMYDAYTSTNRYPYSKPVEGINYIRNSVKVVIDAYDGKTTFYLNNASVDPMIRTYAGIFPTLFRPQEEMPSALRAHVRYPQDLFDVQAAIYETYHMEDPQVFYNKEDLWNVANEKLQDQVQKMESYYAIMRLPGEATEEFIQMIPYTPNKRDNMIAWLCARSDREHYGKMLVFKFPKQDLTYGPMQVAARIDQDPVISSQLTLWNQQGSSVTRGNLLVIPIREEVIYVQPVYLQATSGKLPELKRVIVAHGNRISMETTLEDALARVFGRTEAPAATAAQPAATTKAGPVSGPQEVRQLARSAMDRYTRAMKYLKDGNWTKYGEEFDQLKKDLERLVDQSAK